MNKEEVFALFLVCLIPFMGYIINPNLAYYDSYAFLSNACGTNYNLSGANEILNLLPCNVFLIKIILFSLYFLSILAIAFAGEKYCSKNGWRAGFYSASLTPLLFQEAMKFENDIFGWSIFFIAFALFSIGVNSNKLKTKSISYVATLITCLISFYFWEGSLIGFFALSLIAFELLLISVPIFVSKFSQLYGYAVGRVGTELQIAEEQIGAGMIPMMFLFPAVLDIPKKVRLAGWFTFLVGFLKIKYMLFAIPFFAMGFVEFENKYSEKFKHWPNLILVGFAFCMAFTMLGLFASPNTAELKLVDEAIDLGVELNVPVYNDWRFGWWFVYRGLDTGYKASYPNPDYPALETSYLAFTSQDLNCFLVQSTERIKLYKC